ncbi:MAG TPA: ABC transporter substrate binding protein [Rhodocyclaceae bacterium]|nr:ABC transporter substrate binding protein [Rhodocyclaceae bacterium]
MNLLRRLTLPLIVALACSSAWTAAAEPSRIAVLYAESDEPLPRAFERLIASMEALPNIEVIRLELDAPQSNHFASQLLLASNLPGGPLRLAASSGTGAIAVIYPDIGEPYRSVFTKIIEGIEDKARVKVASYAVGNNLNPQALSGELKRQDIKVVIALGRNGLKAAGSLDKDIGVVASGVISVPETEGRSAQVLSLAPDPALLFSKLRAISPATRRVFVAYDPLQNGWLVRLARDAARNNGIELLAQEAADLKTAVRLYQEFFANADGRHDALWLPQDSITVEESTVLPLVLQESWNRSVPVFSSSVAHVKRGVLFALYPNNMELGRNLAVSALGVASGGSQPRGVQPLRDVMAALNVRTAGHLGLRISNSQQQSFDLLFPEQ